MSPQQLRATLESAIINPLIALLFGAALVVFAWGVVEFMIGLQSGDEHKESGKQHMLWGVIGMAVMSLAFTVVQFAVGTIGATLPS